MPERGEVSTLSDSEYRELFEHFLGLSPEQPSHPTEGDGAPPAAVEGRSRRKRTRGGDAELHTEPSEQRARAESERGRWIGYVGRAAPQFDKLPSGRFRGQFWLGEHTDPSDHDTAIWHRVYCLDRHAESLRRKALTRGMLVEVTGTLQISERPQADGAVKRTESIYCYGIRVLGNDTTSAPR